MPRVLMLNGSPHEFGCTHTALEEIGGTLKKSGVDYEIFWIGRDPIQSCQACGGCARTRGRCVFGDTDGVNDFLTRARDADGFVFGSPVHYSGPSGAVTSFLGRAFFCGSAIFQHKPGAVVASCRRGGSTATFQQLQMYLFNMIAVPTQYWCIVHGSRPEEVRRDLEGMQTMRTLGANMAWLIESLAAARAAGVRQPEYEPRVATNFIPRE